MQNKMKERPILFSAPMVRAILDGRKTQTRRIIKNQPTPANGRNKFDFSSCADDEGENLYWTNKGFWHGRCPYGKPGDRLWVREAFSYHEIPPGEPYFYPVDRLRECVDHDYGFHYWADGNPEFGDWSKKKPSIHMPRSASRILLEITGVRVERLQDISEDDAIAEGAMPLNKYRNKFELPHQSGFHNLWESLSGPGSWDLNPWVWVVEFKVLENGK